MIKLSPTEIFDLTITVPEQVKRFAKHRLELLNETKAAQIWRCTDATSTAYAFDVVSLPGRLIFAGDTGELVLKRLDGWGHEWVQGRGLDEIDYVTSKIVMVPAELPTPAAIVPWLRLQLAGLRTFRRLLLQQLAAAIAPEAVP